MANYKVRMEQLWQHSEQSAHARLMALWQAWIDDPVHGSWAENCLIVKLAAEVSTCQKICAKFSMTVCTN